MSDEWIPKEGWDAFFREQREARKRGNEPWELVIQHTSDGFLVQYCGGDWQGQEHVTVPHAHDDARGQAKGVSDLLWKVINYFVLEGDRFGPAVCRPEIEPGRKYIEPEEDEEDVITTEPVEDE